jgi:hypothetical protein
MLLKIYLRSFDGIERKYVCNRNISTIGDDFDIIRNIIRQNKTFISTAFNDPVFEYLVMEYDTYFLALPVQKYFRYSSDEIVEKFKIGTN